MTDMPANSALTGSSVTEGGYKTALDQALDAIRERIQTGDTGQVTAALEPKTDAASDLGTTSKRYKDGYFSGGLYLGGTAAENLLSAYTKGTWTPNITFGAPGDLSVTYNIQTGSYRRIGSIWVATFSIVTTTFTHSTATGSARVTGWPAAAEQVSLCALRVSGITKTGFTSFHGRFAAAGSEMVLVASGSGATSTTVEAADMPSGGTVRLEGTVVYWSA